MQIGKYYVAIDEFEKLVLPLLTPSDKIKLHIIDEVSARRLWSLKCELNRALSLTCTGARPLNLVSCAVLSPVDWTYGALQ